MEKEKIFCEECGSELLYRVEDVEGWGVSLLYGYFLPHEKYDKKTGKRNMVEVWECPNRKRKVWCLWWSTVIYDKHTRIGKLLTNQE